MTATSPITNLALVKPDLDKRQLLLKRLATLPSTGGPLAEKPDRETLTRMLSHRNAAELLRQLHPVFLAVGKDPALDAKASAALLDMADALKASPSLLSGRTSIKVDSSAGALTLERGNIHRWWLWVRKNSTSGGSEYPGFLGSVVKVMPSGYCWCIPGWEIPSVVEAVGEILQHPGARFRGATFA